MGYSRTDGRVAAYRAHLAIAPVQGMCVFKRNTASGEIEEENVSAIAFSERTSISVK